MAGRTRSRFEYLFRVVVAGRVEIAILYGFIMVYHHFPS